MPEEDFEGINELHEVQTMLAERVQEWTQRWEQQGFYRGKLEGKLEVAKQLLSLGKVSLNDVALATGLSIDELAKALKN